VPQRVAKVGSGLNLSSRKVRLAETNIYDDAKPAVGPITESAFHSAHSLTKYGIAISAIPIVMSKIVLETKYGKIIKAKPQVKGTTARCFRP